jgi:hypothetical protein
MFVLAALLTFIFLLARFMWKGKVAPPAVVCGCGRPTCVYHTFTQEELLGEMTRVVRRLEANERDGRIIRDRLDTEPRNASLMPMQGDNISAFIKIMKDINCLRDCLDFLCRNSTA